jgi:hypothetical protein
MAAFLVHRLGFDSIEPVSRTNEAAQVFAETRIGVTGQLFES